MVEAKDALTGRLPAAISYFSFHKPERALAQPFRVAKNGVGVAVGLEAGQDFLIKRFRQGMAGRDKFSRRLLAGQVFVEGDLFVIRKSKP